MPHASTGTMSASQWNRSGKITPCDMFRTTLRQSAATGWSVEVCWMWQQSRCSNSISSCDNCLRRGWSNPAHLEVHCTAELIQVLGVSDAFIVRRHWRQVHNLVTTSAQSLTDAINAWVWHLNIFLCSSSCISNLGKPVISYLVWVSEIGFNIH